MISGSAPRRPMMEMRARAEEGVELKWRVDDVAIADGVLEVVRRKGRRREVVDIFAVLVGVGEGYATGFLRLDLVDWDDDGDCLRR